MDYLAASGLEPQLAIPVIVVVVGALLVYVFGFQKSEEPSLEHLAVLQSTSSYKARSVSNTKSKSNTSVNNKTKEKPQQHQNGHVVHDKEKNNKEKKKENVQASNNNKENKPPRTPTPQSTPGHVAKKGKQEARPEDFDSGEWIQAVSRKDKKKQVKKDEPKEEPISTSPKSSPKKSPKKEKVEIPAAVVEEVTAVLKEAQVLIQNQTTQTTPKPTPEKKSKKSGAKDASTTTELSSQEATPVKQAKQPQQPKQEKKAPEVVNANGISKDKKAITDSSPAKSVESSPVKKPSISEDTPAPAEPKGVVAFDEMGDNVDAWEEAKSRGNKKRRARKD